MKLNTGNCQLTHYLFCDESGGVSHSHVQNMISAVVISENNQTLSQLVRDVKREAKPKVPNNKVLHATDDPPGMVKNLLTKLASMEQTHLFVSIFNKQWWWNRKQSASEVYDILIAETIGLALTNAKLPAHQTQIVLERSKIGKSQNKQLRSRIAERIDADVDQIELATKQRLKQGRNWVDHLSIADYLAWSYYQEQEKKNSEFVDIISSRISSAFLGIDGSGQVRKISEHTGTFLTEI